MLLYIFYNFLKNYFNYHYINGKKEEKFTYSEFWSDSSHLNCIVMFISLSSLLIYWGGDQIVSSTMYFACKIVNTPFFADDLQLSSSTLSLDHSILPLLWSYDLANIIMSMWVILLDQRSMTFYPPNNYFLCILFSFK